MNEKLILQELLCDEEVPFRVHTARVEKFVCESDLPTLFLTHYDALSDEIKNQHPLTTELLQKTLTKVTAKQACQILGVTEGTISPKTHIKIVGKIVLVLDDLPLALRLTFTNTAKENQIVSSGEIQSLVEQEANLCLFSGAVDVLYKNSKQPLVSVCDTKDDYPIPVSEKYLCLPNSHSTATTTLFNEFKARTPKLAYLNDAIASAVMAYYQNLNNHPS